MPERAQALYGLVSLRRVTAHADAAARRGTRAAAARVATGAVLLQFTLGTVHAWSVFRTPLQDATTWTTAQITLAYTFAIFMLGCSASIAGVAVRRFGSRRVAIAAAVLYGAGTLLAGASRDQLWLLYVAYGGLGGMGLGLGFVVPVTVVLQWFPEHRGLLGGLAVVGFGAGALVASPLANWLMASLGVFRTLAMLGVLYTLLGTCAATLLAPPGTVYAATRTCMNRQSYAPLRALKTPQWCALWLVLLLNVSAGSALLSQAAAMVQEVCRVDAATGALVLSVLSASNAAGRLLWTAACEIVGRRAVFLVMFSLQAVVLYVLSGVNTVGPFLILGGAVVLCYGGGFGTTALLAADYFGAEHVGSIFGLLMTACGFDAVLGPVLIASVREQTAGYTPALLALAGSMLVGLVITTLLRPPAVPAVSALTRAS